MISGDLEYLNDLLKEISASLAIFNPENRKFLISGSWVCPKCGYQNSITFYVLHELKNHHNMLEPVVCNDEEGGCGYNFAVRIRLAADIHVFNITEPLDK